MITCPHCNQRVWPSADGTCPSCRRAVQAAATAIVAEAVSENFAATRTSLAGHDEPGSTNPYRAPQADPYEPGHLAGPLDPRSTAGLWRCGKLLVMRKGAVLPDRCIKTNRPANGQRLKRKLAWHESWVFVLILAGLLIYIIVALILTKRATVYIGLTEEWFAKRRRAIAIGWGAVLLGIGLFIYGIARLGPPGTNDPAGALMMAGAVTFFAGAIYGLVAARIVTPTRIDNYCVWLRGAGPDFLRELPEWTFPRP